MVLMEIIKHGRIGVPGLSVQNHVAQENMFTKEPVLTTMKANASDYQSKNYHATLNFAQVR